ncbi:hypothetical protein QJQ45_026989 [Haematococcus lacustris]|nr:hypothetical protein QJQ45_026989 [Haematococcus lacustris]
MVFRGDNCFCGLAESAVVGWHHIVAHALRIPELLYSAVCTLDEHRASAAAIAAAALAAVLKADAASETAGVGAGAKASDVAWVQLEVVRSLFEEHSSPSSMYKDVRRYHVRMTAGQVGCMGWSSKKSEVRMSRRYVDRSLKKLYLEYEQQRPSHLKVCSTTFELLRPPWVKRITAAHKEVYVCAFAPTDDSDSGRGSDSDTSSYGGLLRMPGLLQALQQGELLQQGVQQGVQL